MASLGMRIRLRRTELGLTQNELAERLNTDQKQISRYENDHQKPTVDLLTKLAVELDTTTDYLLGLSSLVERPLRGEGDLTDQEVELIELYRSKLPDERSKVLDIVKVV